MAFKVGTVMIASGTLRPDQLRVETEPFGRGWEMIKDFDGQLLDEKFRTAGWSFFFMAENIGVTVYGSCGGRTSRRAIVRLLGKVKASSFNCFEITKISAKKFWGIPYMQVSGHSRHVQRGRTLQSLAERSRAEVDKVWASG